jgi:thioredoxin-related protein
MLKIKAAFVNAILISLFLMITSAYATELKWEKSAQSAFSKAMSEKKKILLFVGRENCGKCRYMITQVFESEKPSVKTLLQNNFVLWFSDADESTEWHRTAGGLNEIPLPLICIIDPDSIDKVYEDRTTDIQHSPDFYSRLLKYTKKGN